MWQFIYRHGTAHAWAMTDAWCTCKSMHNGNCIAICSLLTWLCWAQCTAKGSKHAINSRAGIIGFFNSGSCEFESDNGLTEAQRFYETNRHVGRRFKLK